MDNNEQRPSSLKDAIEKVILTGSLSREDQLSINSAAKGSSIGEADQWAIEHLTTLIKEGRINVS